MSNQSPAQSPHNFRPPADGGVRQQWESIPALLRARVETWLGSQVVSAASQPKGFSPGVASRLLTADGRRVFIKAASPVPNPDVPEIHRQEARIVQALPDDLPVPRLLWLLDEGGDGWIVMLFEEIPGRHPALPWQLPELDRVLAAMADLSKRLTPSPLVESSVSTASHEIQARMDSWQRLLNEQPSKIDRLDRWSARHLERLAVWEKLAVDAVQGNTLLHFDIRADNILLTPEKVWFFDWPQACTGADWVDVVFFAPSVTMQGGPQPEQVIARHPSIQKADPAAVTAAVAALAGFFTHRSLQPPPQGCRHCAPFRQLKAR